MTWTARRCNTMLLEGYRKEKAVITSGATGQGKREGMEKICENTRLENAIPGILGP